MIVDDKNVIKTLKSHNLVLGAEPSGHLCLYGVNPTCDALFNSLFFLRIMKKYSTNFIDDYLKNIKYPYVSLNVNVDNDVRNNFPSNDVIKKHITRLSIKNKDVKIVVRPSGTESVIRVYVESPNQIKNIEISKDIEKILKK